MSGIAPARDAMPRSARLQRLALDLGSGRRQALDEFWREMASKGPLIEPLDGDERHELVTFLWRERYDTRNVFLSWDMASDQESASFLKQLPGTDVWYVTLRLRRGSRFSYRLSPNHLPADAVLTRRLDPLNVRVDPEDPTYPYERASVLDMPGAPDERWLRRTPSRRGVIDQKRFTSKVMGNERDIWIYTPPGYTKTGGPYSFVLFFDGPVYVNSRAIDAPRTIDNLIDEKKIKAPIVCFLAPVNRGAEQGGTLAEQYRQAIVTELLPMLRAEYPLTSDPRDTVIAGFSNGGMAAALLAFHHSSVFGNVLSQSGAFRLSRDGDLEPNTISRTFIAEPRRPIRFFLETGFYDNVPAIDAPLHERVLEQSNLMGNRHFRDVLRAKGYDVAYEEIAGTHEVVHWRPMLARGLMSLLALPDQRR